MTGKHSKQEKKGKKKKFFFSVFDPLGRGCSINEKNF
jgi:hypothetical protein